MAEIELTSFEVSLQNLMIALEASDHDEAKHQIKELHPGEIALLFEAIQPKDRSILWPGVEISIQGEILKEVIMCVIIPSNKCVINERKLWKNKMNRFR